MIVGLAGAVPNLPARAPASSIAEKAVSVDQKAGTAKDSAENQAKRVTQRAGQNGKLLTDAEQQRIRTLQQRDREVRAHEMAHVAAGGSLVRHGASFNYENGPDGQRYAIGGEVSIDASPGRDPQETLVKAAQIKAAALAPAEPSPQDRQVAAMAVRMAMQASAELVRQRQVSGNEGAAQQEDTSQTNNPSQGERMHAAYASSTSPETDRQSAVSLFA